jgi:hypothetical protein
MYSSMHSLTSALDGVERSASRPDRFTPRERASFTHWIGGWVGPRAVLDAVVNRKIPSPRRDSKPKTPIVQHVARKLKIFVFLMPHGRKFYGLECCSGGGSLLIFFCALFLR